MPLPDVQTRRLDLGDFSVLVREAGRGAGPPILCLHGGPGMSGAYFFPDPAGPWGPGLRALAERHHVIAYDQRGCGGSTVPEPEDQPLALSRHVDDVERVRSALGLGPVALFGHSFGTVLALLHALGRPESLTHMVLSGGAPTRGFVEGYRRAVETGLEDATRRRLAEIQAGPLDDAAMRERFTLALPLYFHRTLDAADRDALLAHVEFSARVNRALAAAIDEYDMRPALGHVLTPTLVVYGAGDRVVQPEHQLQLRLPAARFVAFQESGHFPFLEEPEPFARVVHYFLRHGAARGPHAADFDPAAAPGGPPEGDG